MITRKSTQPGGACAPQPTAAPFFLLDPHRRCHGRNNAARGVSGFLLCTRPFFLQCLEGPANKVEEVFLKIYRDTRLGGRPRVSTG